jgi:hypothetical protein
MNRETNLIPSRQKSPESIAGSNAENKSYFTTPNSALYPAKLLAQSARDSPDERLARNPFARESNNLLEMYDSSSSIIWSILDIRQADNELIVTIALIERWPVNNHRRSEHPVGRPSQP